MSTRLEYLNKLRTFQGLKPLKSWKEAKAKLETTIADLEGNLTKQQVTQLQDENFEAPPTELAAQTPRPKDPDTPEAIDPNGTLDKLARRDEVTTPGVEHTPRKQGKPRDPTNGGRIKSPGSKSIKRPDNEPMNGAFGEFLRKNNMEAKNARAKLRRAGLRGPWRLTKEIERILLKDGRRSKS